MNNPQVVVDFIANTTGLAGGFKDAGTKSDTFGTKVKSLGKVAVAAAGAAGLAVLVGTVKSGITELTEASKVGAQTNAVIKSTGGAAGVSAKKVADLAGALMKKSGVDDETIQSGENLLLTFTKVQDKAGKGNDIFTQATKTMLDMSVALGTDTKSSAIQLGKALNDPIKGVSALQRVGVTFTAGQKDAIKAMVEAGDTAGAQKLILKELNKEFGGSAEAAGKTLPGQVNVLKESFNNLAGDLMKTLVPALSAITKFFVDHPKLMKAMVYGVLVLAGAMIFLNAALVVTAAVTAGIAAPIAIAIGVIVGLIAVGVLLYKNWDKIKSAATTAWNAIESAITTPLNAVKDAVSTAIDTVKATIDTAWTAIKTITTTAWNAVKTAVSTVIDAVKTLISGIATWIGSTASTALKTALGVFKALFNIVKDAVSGVVTGVKDLIGGIATWLTSTAGKPLTTAINTFKAIFSKIKEAVDAVVKGVKETISTIATWLKDTAGTALSTAVGVFAGLFNKIKEGAEGAVRGVKDAINGVVTWIWGKIQAVRNAASAVAGAIKAPINAIINGWNSLSFDIPKVSIPSVKILGKKIGGGSLGGGHIGFPYIHPLATGGVVSQPTLAMVGEGQGREIVAPEALLRQIMGEHRPDVRVFIGDTELRGIVRTEYVNATNGLARSLLAGAG